MHRVTRRAGMLAIAGLASLAVTGMAAAKSKSVTIPLTGAEEVPPVQTSGSGRADLTYDPDTRVITWTVMFSGLSGPATASHFHGPAEAGKNAQVLVWISEKGKPATSPLKGQATLTPAQAQQFTAGLWYINVHTPAHPGGEIRGQVPEFPTQ
jgi:hypothetical protein